VVLALAALLVLLSLVAGWLRPSVQRARIRTALVTRGPIAETLTASGTVVPEHEHVITSPIDTRVTRILLAPGDPVAAGQPILLLDVGATRLELETLEDRLALKRNERERTQLDLAGQLEDLRGRRQVKELELRSAEFEAARNRQYFEMGLFSRDEVRRAETDAERARIELRQLEAAAANCERTLAARLAGLDLELSILDKERREAARRLELAAAVSDRAGVLTWVVASEGAAVRQGDELARISDLSAFRVDATVSDVHAARVHAGQEATVRAGETLLDGRVTAVRPTVRDGAVTLEVGLDRGSHPDLRPNQRVDVYLITARRDSTLRVARGPFLNRDGRHVAFVVRGDRAVRRPVRLGLASYEMFEILEGLQEGDEVIVSDMSDHMHLEEVRLR
jgi:HlyD family secretion protein